MTERDIALVQGSWERVETAGRVASDLLYARLFALDPQLRALFAHTAMDDQGDRLLMMVGIGVRMLGRFEHLRSALRELGERHTGYGVRWEHYATFGEALLHGLAELLGPAVFTPDLKAAWVEVYTTVATAMHEGYEEVPELRPEMLAVRNC